MRMGRNVRSYEEHKLEVEERRYNVKVVKTAVFGMTDGLLVMFSFVAGISGALGGNGGNTVVIVVSAILALIVESLTMGVAQLLSDKTEKDVIQAWAEQELKAIEEIPEIEKRELVEIYRTEGFSDSTIESMMSKITSDKRLWVKKMLLEELGLQIERLRPAHKDSLIMAATTAVGGMIPLIPLLLGLAITFYVMTAITSAALFALGGAKSYFSKGKWFRSGLEIVALGLGAALVCYAIGIGLQKLV